MDSLEYEKMYQLEESNWWYRGRRDLILRAISRFEVRVYNKNIDILDAGCGTGINLKCIKAYGKTCGLDISKEALKFSSIRGLSPLICGSADKLPLKSESFDLAVALDVLEHIQDDISAIRELNRVLRPDGVLIITVPAFQFLWSHHDEAVHHKRRYKRSELLDILYSEGFDIERATYWNFLLFFPVLTMRLLKRYLIAKEKKQTDLVNLPRPINRILHSMLRLENSILNFIDLPLGISIMCVCRKMRGGQ